MHTHVHTRALPARHFCGMRPMLTMLIGLMVMKVPPLRHLTALAGFSRNTSCNYCHNIVVQSDPPPSARLQQPASETKFKNMMTRTNFPDWLFGGRPLRHLRALEALLLHHYHYHQHHFLLLLPPSSTGTPQNHGGSAVSVTSTHSGAPRA